jgi:predicted acylesterase/phospholipase RssA
MQDEEPTFWGLTPGDWQAVKQFTREKTFERCQVIADRDHPLGGIHFVTSGMVRVADHDRLDMARSGLILDRGDSFGEHTVVGWPAFPSRLEAFTAVTTLFLPALHFPAAAAMVPALAKRVPGRAKLPYFMPRLVAALKHHPKMEEVPVHMLGDLAWQGEAEQLAAGQGPGGPARILYVADGELHCHGKCTLPAGALVFDPEVGELQAQRRTWIVRFSKEVLDRLGHRAFRLALAMDENAVHGPVLVLTDREDIPVSALTTVLADVIQRELPREDARRKVGVLTAYGPGEQAPPAARSRAQASGVVFADAALDAASIDRELAVLQKARAFPILLDVPSLSRGTAAAALASHVAALLAKQVFLTRDSFRLPPAPFADVPFIPAVNVPDTPVDGERGHHPGTIRLRLEAPTLGRRDWPGLSDPELDTISRLGRAVTERLVGVALGGGGAWGYAHLALLRALRAAHLPIDMISGVSFGSLAAGFYAAGDREGRVDARLDELVHKALRLELALLASSCLPLAARWYIDRLLARRMLDDLDIPFHPVGLDLVRSHEWSLGQGQVGEGIRTSSAYSPILAAAFRDTRRSVDGTYINNVPEQVLFQEGASFIVAADVVEPPAPPTTTLTSRVLAWLPPVRVFDTIRATSVLMKVADERDDILADSIFIPPRSGRMPWSFRHAQEIERNASKTAPAFARLAYLDWLGRTY